jgi:hypothetical protein
VQKILSLEILYHPPTGLLGYNYFCPSGPVPVKHTGKICKSLFLILVFLLLTVMNSCMMPELSPEISIGTIIVDKPGEGTPDKPDTEKIVEKIKVKPLFSRLSYLTPALLYMNFLC